MAQTKKAKPPTSPTPDVSGFPPRRDEAPHGDLKVRDMETALTHIKALGYLLWSLPPNDAHEDILHTGYLIMELAEAGMESYGRDN